MMESHRLVLVSSALDTALKDLLVGIARNLELEFHERDGMLPGDRAHDSEIVVVYADEVSPRLLDRIRKGSESHPAAWWILVCSREPGVNSTHIAKAGVLQCLLHSDAVNVLPYLVRSILRGSRRDRESTPETLPLSHDTSFWPADSTIRNQIRAASLPPIPANLLRRLALQPNRVVAHDALIRAGWGLGEGITAHALHVRLASLRKALSEFGLEGSLENRRGRGYVLTVNRRETSHG